VLQLPSEEEQGVASTSYTSIQKLKQDFALVDSGKFQRLLEQKGFQVVEQENRFLPAGKALWLGVFAKGSEACAGAAEHDVTQAYRAPSLTSANEISENSVDERIEFD
jgi:hypothetical protein